MPSTEPDKRSRLNFDSYQIDSLQFKQNPDFKSKKVEVKFSVDSEINFSTDNNALVTLYLTIFKDAKKNNYPFEIELSTTGFFSIENFDIEKDKKLLEINAVAILFPYLRSLVSTITANANVKPLILPPINVINLLSSKK